MLSYIWLQWLAYQLYGLIHMCIPQKFLPQNYNIILLVFLKCHLDIMLLGWFRTYIELGLVFISGWALPLILNDSLNHIFCLIRNFNSFYWEFRLGGNILTFGKVSTFIVPNIDYKMLLEHSWNVVFPKEKIST